MIKNKMDDEKKLKIETLKRGEGKEATKGDTVLVHYTGNLEDGTEFDSSVKREPISFTLGAGQVIEGWEKGVLGMKKGGRRKLIIHPDLAYGEKGIPGTIPENATLIFEVELVEVN